MPMLNVWIASGSARSFASDQGCNMLGRFTCFCPCNTHQQTAHALSTTHHVRQVALLEILLASDQVCRTPQIVDSTQIVRL